jgi:S-methylmethionine-dependent homocysteine/selenocysteine methylase
MMTRSSLLLKTWLLSSEPSALRLILLMDGGVSTHLEHLLEQRNQKFPIRELWSSSLLLSPEGRNTILQGHKDWFLNAGIVQRSAISTRQ